MVGEARAGRQDEAVWREEAARLERRLLDALAAAGRDPARLAPDDLGPVEAFHLGGREATDALLARLPLRAGMELLDIGCGIGGTARRLAHRYDCRVLGVDLDAVFVRVARALSRRVGLADRTGFLVASALDLPVPDGRFEGALTIHVAMAVADKARFYREAFRVVRPGGFFAVYDVVAGPAGTPHLPAPWAEDATGSFVLPPTALRRLVEEAGFVVEAVRERTEEARRALARLSARLDTADPARTPTSHLLMGPNWRTKLENLAQSLAEGRAATAELLCRRP